MSLPISHIGEKLADEPSLICKQYGVVEDRFEDGVHVKDDPGSLAVRISASEAKHAGIVSTTIDILNGLEVIGIRCILQGNCDRSVGFGPFYRKWLTNENRIVRIGERHGECLMNKRKPACR